MTAPPSKGLRVALWVAQGLLALAFLATGLGKLLAPLDALAAQAWVRATPPALVRAIGAVEVLGVLGLLLPSLTRIRPGLTPLAAAGLVGVMAGAAAFHLKLGEPRMIVPNLVLGGLALFVAWGRWKRAPIAPRG